MRYLGLDIGKKNIGVAVGELLAGELTTLRAGKDENFYEQPERAIQEIDRLITSEQAEALVIGLPINEQGESTPESLLIKEFSQALEKKSNLPIHFVDETLTSFMAEDILESQGVYGQEKENRVHQLAAQLILQQFLENEGS